MTKKAITADDGLRYWIDLANKQTIVDDIAARPRTYVCGCRRCEAICISPRMLCSCCMSYSRHSGYPDDGKVHNRMLRNGEYILADEFAKRLASM